MDLICLKGYAGCLSTKGLAGKESIIIDSLHTPTVPQVYSTEQYAARTQHVIENGLYARQQSRLQTQATRPPEASGYSNPSEMSTTEPEGQTRRGSTTIGLLGHGERGGNGRFLCPIIMAAISLFLCTLSPPHTLISRAGARLFYRSAQLQSIKLPDRYPPHPSTPASSFGPKLTSRPKPSEAAH